MRRDLFSTPDIGGNRYGIYAPLDDFKSDSNLVAPVTLSVGYAGCRSGEGCPVDALISQADAMMYAKRRITI